ncbi:MAG TPA: VWA domain-containing protein [Candidatus Acidoferrum sp.]|jgi:VWFA-related protein
MTMKCPRKTTLVAAAACILFTAASGWGQQPTAPDTPTPKPQPPAQNPADPKPSLQAPPPGRISVTTNLVVLPVTVKDRTGNLVADLKKDEFRVFEDKVEQKIFSFTAEAYPLSIVVLIDNDLKQKDAEAVEPSLRAVVGGMSANDEAYVCRFDQHFHEGPGFTRDQDVLLTELRQTSKTLSSKSGAPLPGDPFNGPTINNAPAPGVNPINADPTVRLVKGQATKALDDAVFNAAEVLKDRPGDRRRKIILLISDGQNGSKFNTHKYEEVREDLLRQGIIVYSVAVGSAYFERRFNRLVSYSNDTGGDVYYGARSNSFEDFYARITEQARNQYTLTFSPMGDRKVDYHTVEVRVRREGLTIKTRQGYYGGTFSTTAPQ